MKPVVFRERPSPRVVMDTIGSHSYASRSMPRPSAARRGVFAGFAPPLPSRSTDYRQLKTDHSLWAPAHASCCSCHVSGAAVVDSANFSRGVVPSAPAFGPGATHSAYPQRPCGPMHSRRAPVESCVLDRKKIVTCQALTPWRALSPGLPIESTALDPNGPVTSQEAVEEIGVRQAGSGRVAPIPLDLVTSTGTPPSAAACRIAQRDA